MPSQAGPIPLENLKSSKEALYEKRIDMVFAWFGFSS